MFGQSGLGPNGGHGHGHRCHHGPWGRGAGPGHGKRRFGRGDLRFVILDLLHDGPRHGYDVIRALEERFHGFYSPSPGSVYPTLQMLEDQDFVSSSQEGGKRVYTLTDAGRTYLHEQRAAVENARQRAGGSWGGKPSVEMRDLMHEVRQLGHILMREGSQGRLRDPDTVHRVRQIVASTRAQIEALFSADVPPENVV